MTKQELQELANYISGKEELEVDEARSALAGEPSINQRLTNLETKQTMLLGALNDLHETINEIAIEIRNLKHDL